MPYNYLISKADIVAFKFISANVNFDDKIKPYVKEAQDFELKEALGYAFFYDLLDKYGSENISVPYSNLAVSTFQVGETITANNGATGVVVSDISSTLVLSDVTGDWDAAASITGGTSNATADKDSVTYGKYYKLVKGEEYTDPNGHLVLFPGLKAAIAYWAFARYRQNAQEETTATGFVNKTNPYSEPTSAKTIAERVSQARSGALAYFNDAVKYICDKNHGTVTYDLWHKTPRVKKSGGVKITSINRFDSENTIYQ